MLFKTLLPVLLAPLAMAQSSEAPSASASAAAPSGSAGGGDYLTQVITALNAANLTGLVGVATAIAATPEGQALLAELGNGNKTVFAPNNEAFAAVPEEISSNTTLLTSILSYHILNNTYTVNGTAVAPAHTIARTVLNTGDYALPGNRSAPLVLARNASDATNFQILQASSNVSVTGPAVAANLNVYIIDTVLSLPPTLGEAATELLPSLAGVVQSAGLLEPLQNAEAITIFAPANSAIDGAAAALGQLNATAITSILANHVVNGSIVYSTELTSANYTSAGGSPFTFTSNATGAYVSSANSTARIVQSDIIIQNGVVHVIDGILLNTNSNPQAAGEAYSSGIENQVTRTEANTPQTSAPSPTGSGGSSASPTGAAGKITPLGLSGSGIVGGVFAMVSMVVGGTWLLM